MSIGWESGIKDLYQSPKGPTITREAEAWVISVAHTRTVSLGQNGHTSLSMVAESRVQRILDEQESKLHKVRYYLERRGRNLNRKIREILMLYRDVSKKRSRDPGRSIRSVSTRNRKYKPWAETTPEKHPAVSREHEYDRMGTLLILVALDLHNRHVMTHVHECHRRRKFVELLK